MDIHKVITPDNVSHLRFPFYACLHSIKKNVLYLPSASGYSKVHVGGAEHTNIRNKCFKVNITGLKIPTDRRQASWLVTSVAEELNSGLP